jgi:hypothetical protein
MRGTVTQKPYIYGKVTMVTVMTMSCKVFLSGVRTRRASSLGSGPPYAPYRGAKPAVAYGMTANLPYNRYP